MTAGITTASSAPPRPASVAPSERHRPRRTDAEGRDSGRDGDRRDQHRGSPPEPIDNPHTKEPEQQRRDAEHRSVQRGGDAGEPELVAQLAEHEPDALPAGKQRVAERRRIRESIPPELSGVQGRRAHPFSLPLKQSRPDQRCRNLIQSGSPHATRYDPRRSSAIAGCSAAWLAHLSGGQGVAGSNPVSPTIFQPAFGGSGPVTGRQRSDAGSQVDGCSNRKGCCHGPFADTRGSATRG